MDDVFKHFELAMDDDIRDDVLEYLFLKRHSFIDHKFIL